ncbi:hypothetical protein FPZ54_08965 [Sphingomonas suaedae]|uniref:Uncharacterized protein n=1 Tax=Sphingomonas suaedae TaxID=2599297 RepID=A0A518RFE1_9SPHN|nr:hypothetical protein FPZ54_08965 [Sphingomonas suaedae]
MLFGPIAAAVTALLASETVPLANVHADPDAYEGKIIDTCGDAGGGDTLFLQPWVSGRSRGGVQLDRPLKEHGDICLRAQVLRVSMADEEKRPVIVVSHPPVILKGWHLRVIKLLKRR